MCIFMPISENGVIACATVDFVVSAHAVEQVCTFVRVFRVRRRSAVDFVVRMTGIDDVRSFSAYKQVALRGGFFPRLFDFRTGQGRVFHAGLLVSSPNATVLIGVVHAFRQGTFAVDVFPVHVVMQGGCA